MRRNGNSRPRVVVSCRAFDETLALLGERCDVVANQTGAALSPDALLDRCRDADALMAFMPDRIDGSFLQACPNLKAIGCALKGYDNFDVEACTAHGVWITIVPDLLTVPTAELAVGLMIGLGRNMLAGDRLVRKGFEGWRPVLYGRGLANATVGIVGMGKVGSAIAERLAGFGVSLIYADRQPLPKDEEKRIGISRVDLETLARSSDFVVLATPLTLETEKLVDAAFLREMKQGAYLINPARGSVVDEDAVADALETGRLRGYAADVFAFEDWARPDRPRSVPRQLLADRERTLLTPHIGSADIEVRRAIERDAALNILEALAGETPHGAINDVGAFRNAATARSG